MANRIFLLIILVVSLSSCDLIERLIDDKITKMAYEATRQKQEQEVIERLTNKEYLIKSALFTMAGAINQGYYVHYDYDGILSIFIEDENSVVIKNFNIIDGIEISNEIITFNLFYDNEIIYELDRKVTERRSQNEISFINNENIYNKLNFSTTDEGFWRDVSFSLYNDNYVFYVPDAHSRRRHFFGTVNDKHYPLEFLSISKDENVIEYTYDYKKQYLENQKQYTGTYYYDSHIIYGMSEEEFIDRLNDSIEQSFIINIDEEGLFLVDKSGNAIYNYGDLVVRTLIHDKNKETQFWGHAPAYGYVVKIYYQNDTMNYKIDCDPIVVDDGDDRVIKSGAYGYHVIYRKAGL